MDMRYPPEAEAYREKVQAFLAEHLPADWRGIGALDPDAAREFTAAWRKVLFDNGYLGVPWPVEYDGAGLSALENVILAEELHSAVVPRAGPKDVGVIQ